MIGLVFWCGGFYGVVDFMVWWILWCGGFYGVVDFMVWCILIRILLMECILLLGVLSNFVPRFFKEINGGWTNDQGFYHRQNAHGVEKVYPTKILSAQE